MKIELPFPPASLSGHSKGTWHGTSPIVAKHRAWAFAATKAARISVPAEGDIAIAIHFTPPDDRGDRVNFPIRIKSLIDGIADALGINDKQFLPSYHFHAPEKPGKVVVEVLRPPLGVVSA